MSTPPFTVLVTGANSGLGFSICCRLVDEFLQTRSHDKRICVVITTRSKRKGDDTVARLWQHVHRFCRPKEGNVPGTAALLERRVDFRQEILDLTSIVSVQQLAKKILQETENGTGIQRLDALICNAGIGGWSGLNWPKAIWLILTTGVQAVTYPSFKNSDIGLVTKPQVPAKESPGQASNGKPKTIPRSELSEGETRMGEVFCANVFGHYLLAHYLAPLLSAQLNESPSKGRIIWVSSLEAYERAFSVDDIQGLESPQAYESSKRLTDLLAITSDLPSTSRSLESFFSPSASFPLPCSSSLPPPPERRPRHYLSQPGICATSIMPLPLVLTWAMALAFYIARWCGSPWHPVTGYLGATAPVWLALVDQSTLDAMEKDKGKSKWGSSTDMWGSEKVEQTEIEGWGWGGKEGERPRKYGRKWGAKLATQESREAFVDAGRRCWAQMEQLREEWELRLKGVVE